ncbi:NAD(P)/FAD-dependent oxidoreductase [Pseudoalteromonas byunsanensis]|uniref:Amino acid dehydrogenase n=1 Tax=Pseudoalteromonas byunsanensis TaxID=327939 RepID=A0A1S1NB88_9GAMM|nr:FAD-dependent oxidoreductase [Pseudoalteromonas byunsanensis]OHU96665.1 amino acid dehydrogenase [Pseudoalteromonas byunsanensis]
MAQQKQHIAVIGAGIVGLCTAKRLQDLGFSVTLFDPTGIAQRCSKGNAGHFASEQVFPLASAKLLPKLPGMLLNPLGPLRIDWRYALKMLPWFLSFLLNMRPTSFKKHTQALRALNESSLAAYQELLADSDYGSLITKNGSLLTFETSSSKRVEKTYLAFKAQGVSIKWLKGKEIQALEPTLSSNVKHALLFCDVGHTTDPHVLCRHIYQRFVENGGLFARTEITEITPKSNQVELLTDKGENLVFDKAVLCTGAWSKPLAKQLGFKVPLDTERGYHAMLNELGALSRPVASAERQFIITPMQSGLRLAGTVEFAGLDAPERNERATMLLAHAQQLVQGLEQSQVTQTWMGCRPSLPDSLPIICRSPKHDNILFAFGHQHLGLTQAAITAKLVGQLCMGEQPALDLTPYRIDRF